jgi:quercetin dioxygenase-like cupin family protein
MPADQDSEQERLDMGEWEEWQVLSRDSDKLDRSEMAAREQFLRDNPPVTGLAVPEDLREIELIQRPWRNNMGRWFELAANRVLSAHLAELPPGGNSVRHRHTTEAYIYIVMGRGFSIVNYDGEPEDRIEWSEGSLFSPPVWAWHQHFNADLEQPARYLAIQDTGLVRHMRLHNIERHPTQKKMGEGTDYVVDAVPAEEAQSAEVQ